MTREVSLAVAGCCAALVLGGGCASVPAEKAATPAPATAAATATNAAPAAAAQPAAAAPAEGYAWDELARLAAAASGEARALLWEAEAERRQAAVDTAWRNPRLSVGGHWGDEDERTPGRTGRRTFPGEVGSPSRPFTKYREWGENEFDGTTANLRVYTGNPFVNRWLRRRGAASAQAKEAESKEAAYAVFVEVRGLCLEAEVLREEIELLEQMAALRGQMCAVRREQAEAGVASALEHIRAETRHATLLAEIADLRAERQRLLRRVAALAALPEEQVRLRPLEAESPAPARYLDAAALTDLAFLRRPDLERARQARAAAAFGVDAARAGQIPWFEFVEAGYEEERATAYDYEQHVSGRDRSTSDETEWQVRAAVTLPVFNWLGDELRLSRAQLTAAEAREQGLYDEIRREVEAALHDYRQACEARDRSAAERARLCSGLHARIDALADEPLVGREDVLATREELLRYLRVCMRVERECLRQAQALEAVSGGALPDPSQASAKE